MKWLHKIAGTVKQKQRLAGIASVSSFIVLFTGFLLWAQPSAKKVVTENAPSITGITGSEFTEKNTESALTTQQSELGRLEDNQDSVVAELNEMKERERSIDDDLKALMANQDGLMKRLDQIEGQPNQAVLDKEHQQVAKMMEHSDPAFQPYPEGELTSSPNVALPLSTGRLTRISFQNEQPITKNNDTFVPPGTFSTAVVLGGADTDASVNGQSQQSPLLFKLLDNGSVPGGGHSHLKNCVIIGSAYGDISSERALTRLKHITCGSGKNTTVDTEIEGWAWYHGKSGIKGVPLMRDDKVLTWSFISGLASGFANAAQYAQTDQSISALGTVNTVSSGSIASYGAYGGAATAMNNLSNYYIKRADQYHPVIQIGAGNKVTIVFESGFFIVPHEKKNGVDTPLPRSTGAKLPPDIVQQLQRNQDMIAQLQKNNNAPLGQTIGVTS